MRLKKKIQEKKRWSKSKNKEKKKREIPTSV